MLHYIYILNMFIEVNGTYFNSTCLWLSSTWPFFSELIKTITHSNISNYGDIQTPGLRDKSSVMKMELSVMSMCVCMCCCVCVCKIKQELCWENIDLYTVTDKKSQGNIEDFILHRRIPSLCTVQDILIPINVSFSDR